MKFRFAGKKIPALVTTVPSNAVPFEDEISNFNFPPEKTQKLKKVMGFGRHRLVKGEVCASDLALDAAMRLLESGVVRAEEIGALIFVSQTPDHLIPPTSNILQGKLGLGQDVFCMDINQGCAGFVIGLIQSFLLLEHLPVGKVLLLNGDTLSRRCGRHDRNIFPMVGDAGSAAIVENDPSGGPIYGTLRMDGTRCGALQIPAGGFRRPSTPDTAVEKDVGDGNLRSEDHFFMDGPAVFNFVQTEAPPMIRELVAFAGVTLDDVEAFLFHQPNRFMLEKLASALKVSTARMPNNVVENFGNASSVTIPTNIVFNCAETLRQRSMRACLAGFGVGLTWTSLLMDLGPMQLCELREVH